MPASSWTTCEWELQPELVSGTELVSSTGAVYSVREQATQRKRWLAWMDEYAASGRVKWKPNVVDTRRDGDGQPEVRKTALTGKGDSGSTALGTSCGTTHWCRMTCLVGAAG